MWHIIHVTYKTGVNRLFLLLVGLLFNRGLSVVKCWGSQKSYMDFSTARGSAALLPTFIKGELYPCRSSLLPSQLPGLCPGLQLVPPPSQSLKPYPHLPTILLKCYQVSLHWAPQHWAISPSLGLNRDQLVSLLLPSLKLNFNVLTLWAVSYASVCS